MGSLDGKVALVSGAARGQGRSHAVRLAEEGADIIAFDICAEVDSTQYELATREDLEQTVAMVEATDRRIVSAVADVRDAAAVAAVVSDGVAQLGRLDIVVANAGIVSYFPADQISEDSWNEMIGINLTGVWNTVSASLRPLIDGGNGGAIVLISSSAALVGLANVAHYSAAKAGLVGLMQSLSVELGPHAIRVNTIHPTAVGTPMVQNKATYELMWGEPFTGDDITVPPAAVGEALTALNSIPVPWVESEDTSNAILFLVGDTGRYVTGTQLRVDAGSAAK